MADANQPVDDSASRGGAARHVDFVTLVLSLRQGTLELLGLVEGSSAPPDLDGARVQIDMLEVLQEKTTGNLDAEEERLLSTVLYEVRLAWLEVRNKGGAPPE